MADLVERLRAADATLTEDNWHTEAKVCREAADEIERLKEILQRIASAKIAFNAHPVGVIMYLQQWAAEGLRDTAFHDA